MEDGIGYAETGVILPKRESVSTVLVLSSLFPWSPALLNIRFKLKVVVFSDSAFLSLARAYHERFGIRIEEARSFNELLSLLKEATVVIDEGWKFQDEDLVRLSRMARDKPILKVGGSYRISACGHKGGIEKWNVEHWKVGGVTDITSSLIRWYSESPGVKHCKTGGRAAIRDLRSVLKAGLRGKKASKPSQVPHTPTSQVLWVRPNEVLATGIYPLSGTRKFPLVRTVFDGDSWVTRDLSPTELLMLKDVPEPLVLLIAQQEGYKGLTKSLFDSCRVPLKSLEALLIPVVSKLIGYDANEQAEVAHAIKATVHRSCNHEDSLEREKVSLDPAEMEEEEDRCVTVGELIHLLQNRIADGQSEGRSKRSDYEAPLEAIWDVRTLPFCRIKSKDGSSLKPWREAFLILRHGMLKWWKKRVVRSAVKFLTVQKEGEEYQRNLVAIRDCVRRVADASIWEWDGGSRPFFWMWPVGLQKNIRDGFPLWIRNETVEWNEPQPKPSAERRELMLVKIADVRRKGYLVAGKPSSLIRFFGVPKGENDIRMVYDGTKSGLNSALWAPWFPLPTASTHLKMVERTSWMADNDAGEFFLNWMMDERVRNLCGVDLTHFLNSGEERDKSKDNCIEMWTRCAMGLRPSPYICVKGMLLAKEFIMGDPKDELNIFCYDHVLFNLPGMESFDSAKPWVSKRRADGTIAADVVGFVDDLRPIASSEGECWEASQLVSKRLAYLGLQDASRKRNPPSKTPGPWAGIVVSTDDEKVHISVSQKKWDKTKEIIEKIRRELQSGRIDFKNLESMTGYLVYVAQAYPAMKPYLSGLYGTLNSWRPNRTPEGFKLRKEKKRPKRESVVKEEVDFEQNEDWRVRCREEDEDICLERLDYADTGESPPSFVRFVKRAEGDVAALEILSSDLVPPLRVVRGGDSVSLIYGFGDASGSGFGAAIQLPDGGLFWRSGTWEINEWTIVKEMSSNYRELRNLVDSVEAATQRGLLTGCQLMLFTDNTTAEASFHKGGSTSPELHELVLRLRKLEVTLSAELIVVHVSGKRMIESGVDGISRGDKNSGLMAGQSIHSFIPLHLSALERNENLSEWVASWAESEIKILSPSRWPDAHLEGQTYLWAPPPAAAEAACEWLSESIHKRSGSIHVVVIPRLMTSKWRKTLGKICDVEIVIPCGTPVWPAEMYEPLILGISLPLLRSCFETGGWRYKRSERVHRLSTSLPGLWEDNFRAIGDSLRKLLREARAVRAL